MIFDFFQQAKRIHRGNDGFASIKTVKASEGLGDGVIETGISGQNIDQRQVVSFAHGIIIKVVSRRNFNAAGAKFCVHVVVSNDRNFPITQR